jgi:uncharacterized RDD family membrane protein YckC
MKESEEFTKKKDVQDQEAPLVYLKTEELNEKPGEPAEKPEKIDYSKVYVLPTIKARYTSMLIDVLIIVLLSIGITSLIERVGGVPGFVKGILFIVVVLLYEPILVSSGTTIGQLIMNLRVRNFKQPDKKLTIQSAILRSAVKIFLGWLSFVTITFNVNRRAIHDMASGSIVISNKI